MSTLWCSHEVPSLSISINSLYLSLEHLQNKGLSNVWNACMCESGKPKNQVIAFSGETSQWQPKKS